MLNVKSLGVAAIAATGIGLAVGSVVPAEAATFLGQTVQADNLFPNKSTVAEPLGAQVIGAGGATFTSNGLGASALVTSTNILITNLTAGAFTPSPFNGFRFRDVNQTIDSIIGVTLASSNITGFDISRVTFDADQIFVNLAGLSAGANQTVSLDVKFAAASVPTPALLPGLLGLGAAAIRKRKGEASEESEESTKLAEV